MIQYIKESYNRKIKLTESVNNIISEDEEFDKYFSQEYAKKQQDIHASNFKDIKNLNVKSLNVPLDKQDGKHTYTYVEDHKTAEKVLRYMTDYFKAKGFVVGNVTLDVGINKIIKEVDQYEPLFDDNKFLSNGIFSAYFKDKVNKNSKAKVNVSAAINSIKIDSPEFDDFSYNDNKFIIYIESNGLRVKNVDTDKFNDLIQDVISNIKKIINDNWEIKTNIKTNAEIDKEG